MMDELRDGRPAVVLLAEDNEDDVMLTRLSFENSRIKVNLHVTPNGEECMSFLRREGRYAQVPAPDMLLLDLNMPRMDGREVLAAIAADEQLRHLPVIILTTSEDEQEVLKMYQLRCSSYIVKPVDFDKFQRVVRTLTEYWFTVVVLPETGG